MLSVFFVADQIKPAIGRDLGREMLGRAIGEPQFFRSKMRAG